MRLRSCALLVAAGASAAAANPTVDPDARPTIPGILRVIAPEEARRVSENRAERLLETDLGGWTSWSAAPADAPRAPCTWTTECRGEGPAPDRTRDVALEAETVEVVLIPPEFEIHGRYRFRNLSGEPVTVAYPLPQCHGEPSRLSVRCDRADGSSFEPTLRRSGACVRWDMSDECEAEVSYRQRMVDSRAMYVLTTSLTWPRPIEKATIRVRCPPQGALRANYLLRSDPGSPGRLYTLVAENFRPSRDLVVQWEPIPDGSGGISGRALDESGNPLPNVNVLLRNLGRGVLSGRNGEFSFPDVPAGVHAAEAMLIGYASARGEIHVWPGKSTEIEVTLFPQASAEIGFFEIPRDKVQETRRGDPDDEAE